MKKIIMGLTVLLAGTVMAQQIPLDYSMETQKNIQRLKENEGYKDFCTEYMSKVSKNDKVGLDVIKSICVSDYFNYNSINDWGEEIYNIAMSNNKKPELYNYALPVGRLDKELFLASNVLLSSIFWTSVDRYNLKAKETPEKESVTKEQYAFFNDLYKKIKDPSSKNLKPVMTKVFNVKGYDMKDLRGSKTFIHYAESMVKNTQFKNRGFENMDVVMSSFDNYKSYLDFVYSKKMDEVLSQPKKINGYKFTKVQCAALGLALSSQEFDSLKKEANFQCDK